MLNDNGPKMAKNESSSLSEDKVIRQTEDVKLIRDNIILRLAKAASWLNWRKGSQASIYLHVPTENSRESKDLLKRGLCFGRVVVWENV